MADDLSSPPPDAWYRGITRRRWWPWFKHGISLAFFCVVAWLVVSQARTIAWGSVWTSLQAMPWQLLAAGCGIAVLTHLAYSCFDLIGRHCARHTLPAPLVLLVAFVSYAFTLNVGTLVGGVAFRWRLYDHFGLNPGAITHVTLLSMVTNWIGYSLLAGGVLLAWPPELPPGWPLDGGHLRILGSAALAIAAAYVLFCALRRGRQLDVGSRRILMPGWRTAVLQEGLSALHWALMASIIYLLLGRQVAYTAVLATLLVAAVAGVLAHVPAGLGVTEAVFVALLGHQVDKGQLLAALLAYRAVYYLGPLAIASVAAGVIEFHRRRDAAEEAQVAAAGPARPVPPQDPARAPAKAAWHSQ